MHKDDLRVNCRIESALLQQWLPEAVLDSQIGAITGVCLDSRVLQPGDLFFAIKAARDGHDFVQGALDKGAAAVVVDHDMHLPRQIIVAHTLQSLHKLAKQYRQAWSGIVVGVSGSNGKTTTKEMLHTLLGEEAFSTPGTWNNHLGIPLSLLMLRPAHHIAVIEMGINQFGDLESYCQYAMPDIGVLTVIGDSHLMHLKNREGVLKAKSELFACLPQDGIAVINIDDPYLSTLQEKLTVDIVTVSAQTQADVFVELVSDQTIKVQYGQQQIETAFHLGGQHNRNNLACALGVAMACGKTINEIQDRIAMIKPLDMRMQEYKTDEDIRIIVDCYNANPTSTMAGLTMVSTLPGRKVVLLGDMLELGEQSSKMHMDLARKLFDLGIDQVFLLGQFAKDYYQGALLGGLQESQIHLLDDRKSAYEKIHTQLQSGDIL
ncbi:MAG: UDP-N-acetylmuramoyl-tripeptide--D-alanyl-D-alanine ligase [Bdellovibrionota bacterium]